MNDTAERTRFCLRAETAEELMTPHPVTIRREATLTEAAALLTSRGISEVPVIDEEGRVVGVLSQRDIVRSQYSPKVRDSALVWDAMTRNVVSVCPQDSVSEVLSLMLSTRVHRLFVVRFGVLMGVISAVDVLRRLRLEEGQ